MYPLNENAKNIFNSCAQEYQEKFMDVSAYKKGLRSFINTIPNKNSASILEIGCGPGNITSFILNHLPSSKILATDIAPNMLALAQKNNPSITVQELNANNISEINSIFDAIVIGFCFPYLSKKEIEQLAPTLYKLLDKNGVIYISTIKGEYQNSGFIKPSTGNSKGAYTYFYSLTYLTEIFKQFNFSIIDFEEVTYRNAKNIETTDLCLIVQKK